MTTNNRSLYETIPPNYTVTIGEIVDYYTDNEANMSRERAVELYRAARDDFQALRSVHYNEEVSGTEFNDRVRIEGDALHLWLSRPAEWVAVAHMLLKSTSESYAVLAGSGALRMREEADKEAGLW
tara:strand:+ start:631 stop:1008 length:378 start_codon:yes stop_codon:yes gene_type:complete